MTSQTPTSSPSPNYAKTAIILVGFALSFFLVDRGLGAALSWGLNKTVTGEGSGQANFALRQKDKDVIIFGSSRAKQHFDPVQLKAQTGLSAYNAGANGQGLYYARGLQMVMLKRNSKAKYFVIHVDAVDLITPFIKRAAFLLPFMDEAPALVELFAQDDRWLWLKSKFKTYRFNSMALPIIKNLLIKRAPNPTGFTPKKPGVKGVAAADQFIGGAKAKVKLHKGALEALRAFIKDAKKNNITTIIVTSPMNLPEKTKASAQPRRTLADQALRKIANEEGAQYYHFDEKTFPQFQDASLFIDRGHLNSLGAKALTQALAGTFKTVKPSP